MPSQQRDPRIDLLRGIAVSLVLLLHFSLTYRLPDSWLGEVFTPRGVARLVMNGNYGVTVFFVISGFLITRNVLVRYGSLQRLSGRAFYIRRAARIGPPLLLALAVILVLGLLGEPSFMNRQNGVPMAPGFWWTAIGSVLTFWHNVLMRSEGYFNYALNIYWSLSVEEVFYLVFPIVCIWLTRGAFIALCCALVVAGPIYRAMHVDDEIAYLYGYFACFDAIALGCLTALIDLPRSLGKVGRTAITVLVVAGWILVHFAGIGGHEVFGFTGIAACTALLIVARPPEERSWSIGRWSRPVSAPLNGLRWMGRHSYELYLFHIIVLGLMRDLVPREAFMGLWKLPGLLLFWLLSVFVTHFVGRYVSEPLNGMIRRRTGSALQ